jgi:hypothetical protein
VPKKWFVAGLIALFANSCAAQFFPQYSLDLDKGGLKAQWYSRQLHALNEPSLSEMAASPSAEVYRFLWLRSFHHPIAIRLEVRPDGTGVLTTRIASGAGGYAPGKLIRDSTRALTKADTYTALAKINSDGFWEAPNPVDDQGGTDGSQWVIEGVRDGKYHVVDRWTPSKGVAHDLGIMFAFDLAKLNLPKDEVY